MGESAGATARIVGRYAIFDEIASGGMATVYLGRLMGSGGFTRTVAIKSLHPQFAKDPEFVTMFLDEARLAARIRHPNVVPTLDVVASRGEVFLVMEYVQGESLSRLARTLHARGERVPLPILLRIMSDALQGLHAAHEARDERGVPLDIVHRDVSPQNILVGSDGVGRLLDFGVAKAAGRAQTTREGQIKGKLAYMAPEQLTNAGISRQTDVYAASVVLWELLAGERLFAGGSELDLMARLLRREIRRPGEVTPGLPPALDDVVMKGLAANVADRFASAREMCVALGSCGVAEAPAVLVGEWVEQLAAEALAQRTAKIAAIETRSDATEGLVDGQSLRPSGAPTVAPPAHVLSPGPRVSADAETSSDVLAATLSAGTVRQGARVRLIGAGVALVAAVLGVKMLLTRANAAPARESPAAAAGDARVAEPPPASVAPPSVARAGAPGPAPAGLSAPPTPAGGAALSGPPIVASSEPKPATPPARRRAAAAARPSATRASDGVFDSRE